MLLSIYMDDLGELMIRRAIITFDYVMLGRWLNSGSVKDACIRMIIPRSNLPTLSLSLYIYIHIHMLPPPRRTYLFGALLCSLLWELCGRARSLGFGNCV